MSLNDDFKNLKLKKGQKYFCNTPTGIDVFEFGVCRDDPNNIWGYLSNERHFYNNICHFDDVNVLSLCDYEELQQLKSENAELIETNDSLTRQVEHLLDLQKEEDKEVEKLRKLLKKCKSSVLFEADVVRETSGKHSNDYKMLSNILTRINAAIGESEE